MKWKLVDWESKRERERESCWVLEFGVAWVWNSSDRDEKSFRMFHFAELPFWIEEFHWTFFSNQRTKSSNPHQKNWRLIWPKLLNTFSNCSSGKIAAFALSHMLWMCSLISRTMWRISFLSVGVRTCMDVSHMCELFVGSGLISFSHSFECRLCDFPREKHVYAARDAPFWPPLSQTHTHKLTRSLICSCIFTQLTCHWIFRIVLRITHSIIIVNNV